MDGTSFSVATAADLGEGVFVYGSEQSDVRAVDYEAIAMLNVSATPELSRRISAKDAEIAGLKAEIASLKAENAEFADLAGRMESLEKRVSTQLSGDGITGVALAK